MRTNKSINNWASHTFDSLKVRNFRLYFFGQIISNSGNWLTNVALTLLVLKLTNSGTSVGILAACQYGPILLLSPYGGTIADRHDKRAILFVTQSLEMAQSAGLAVLAFMPHPSVALLYALAVAGGVFLAFDNPLRRSFVSEMVDERRVPNAVLLYSTIVNVSRVIGPAIAGVLVITAGYGWCFTLDATSYIAVLAGLFLMKHNELHHSERRPKTKGEVRAGLNYIRSYPLLWINFVMLAMIGILSYNFVVTLPLFVKDALHYNTSGYTILFSVMGAGSVVAALTIAQRRNVHVTNVIAGATMLGGAMLLLALTPNLVLALPLVFVIGMASILYSTATTALVQIRTESYIRGRVLALQSLLLIGTAPIGGPLLGWLADLYGGRLPLVIGGAASLLAAAFGGLAVKRLGPATIN